jgi:hypothetical protein
LGWSFANGETSARKKTFPIFQYETVPAQQIVDELLTGA